MWCLYITIYENELKSRWFEFVLFFNFLFSRFVLAEFKEQKTCMDLYFLKESLAMNLQNFYKTNWEKLSVTSFFVFFNELRSLELLGLRNEVFFFWKNSCSYIRWEDVLSSFQSEKKKHSKPFLSFFDLRHSLNLRCDRRYFWCVWVRVGVCVCARKLVTTRKFYAVI